MGIGLKVRRPVGFLSKYAIEVSMQSILASIFCKGLLRLSAGTNEATSLTAANLVNHLERFWPTSVRLVLFGNRFSLV